MSSPGESRSRSGRDTPETLDTTYYSQRVASVGTRKTNSSSILINRDRGVGEAGEVRSVERREQ